MTRIASRSKLALGGTSRPFAFALLVATVLVVFAIACVANWRLPGLYMDAANPEYILPGIFDPSAAGNRPWILPGNLVHGRLPVFTGTIYHGSTQLYFAVPFMALFGIGIASLRIVQGVVGGIILALLLNLARRGDDARITLAVGATGLIAIDPAFTISLRTQAYSCLFPMMFLIASMLLLRRWQERPRGRLALAGSGFLYGISVFSYFIFAFFLPALIGWLLRGKDDAGRRDRIIGPAIWIVTCAVGYAPFLVGLWLVKRKLGGITPLLHWIHERGHSLNVMGANTGVLDRVQAVSVDAFHAVTGEWPWLMILKQFSGDSFGLVKAAILLALPIAVIAGAGRARRERKRATALPLLFAFSFIACASIFGERLGGHHYTVLVPLLYLAFGAACVALWPNTDRIDGSDEGVRAAIAQRSIVAAAVLLVGCADVSSSVAFHERLRETGGVGLYSDAIDRFSLHMLRHDPTATAYFPDWGFVMPFVYLTRAQIAQHDAVDPDRIHREACSGKPQIVVFGGSGNRPRFDLVASLADQPLPEVTVWRQRDGVAAFESARYAPAQCAGTEDAAPAAEDSAAQPARPMLTVNPTWSFACDFLSPRVANIRWKVPDATTKDTEIWIETPQHLWKEWFGDGASGERSTDQWAVPGMKFAVLDARTKRHLAEAEIQPRACPVN